MYLKISKDKDVVTSKSDEGRVDLKDHTSLVYRDRPYGRVE